MKEVVFLSGKIANLRPYNKERDLQNCQRWINDPELRLYIKNTRPISLKLEEEVLDKKSSETKTGIFLIIETKGGKPVGVMSLEKINWTDRTATTGAFIGEKEYWGNGYGTDAKMILLDYAFNTLNLRKINSSAKTFNKRSLAYNMKCGYKIEGVSKKQHYCNGKYIDAIMIAVFKKDFLPIWRKYSKGR